MTNELQLMVPPKLETMVISLTPEGEAMREAALAKAGLIGRVSNEIENSKAVAVQVEMKNCLNALEKTRVELTEPALLYQRALKKFFDGKAQELKDELMRVGVLSEDYGALLRDKARAEEAARNEELTKLERERQAALAKVNSHEEREEVQAKFDARTAVEAPPVAGPALAKGQSIDMDLDVQVTDVWTLARAHPSCVKIEPRMSEIKSLIKAGIKVAGVQWREKTKQTIRASRQSAPINV